MQIVYRFPNKAYTAFSLDAIEELGKKIAPEWHIYNNTTWHGGEINSRNVDIWGPEGLWREFQNTEEAWIVLTADGVPFESFNSLDDLEEAVAEGTLFMGG